MADLARYEKLPIKSVDYNVATKHFHVIDAAGELFTYHQDNLIMGDGLLGIKNRASEELYRSILQDFN